MYMGPFKLEWRCGEKLFEILDMSAHSVRHTSTKKKRRLCDLSGKRHRVFSSVASMASVVPLCRLCGKKALCTFLHEISLFFHSGKYTVPFFHRGDTEAP